MASFGTLLHKTTPNEYQCNITKIYVTGPKITTAIVSHTRSRFAAEIN